MTTSNSRPFRLLSAARGFTLIEFMIVLVIMGVVIAFVGPRVAGGLTGLDTRKTALQTAAMLRYARSKAVNTGCRYHVIFDGVGRRVILLQASREDSDGPSSPDMDPDAGGEEPDARIPGQMFSEPDGFRKVETEKKFYSLPDGVFFENVIVADIESAGFGDDMIMMLSFYPNGTSLGAEVTIADERGRRYFITVSPLSGSVRVDEESDDA